MYLKKIEVQGFKSFANRLVFEFDNGITGIVGPNGSGKSNIADAVRWVLGEQSAKQLRGSKMEDVIFAGTEARKPVSFAAVSLTIDNSDHQLDIEYDELTVTRRVFRSGESEYLINGNNCRLMDIHELFYDTGIGKDGYSIIGQGQIDRILSGKPEERRELFDEAAGIVKFKKRRARAQKSLDNHAQNLVRINDILSELEKQVGPLARQSEKAREYLKLKENLKNYEVNLFLADSERLKKSIAELDSKLSIVEADMQNSQKEFEEIKSTYEEKDQAIRDISNEIDEISTALNKAEIDKNRLISQIDILKEQIKSANMNDEHIAERIRAINSQIEERVEEKSSLIKKKFELDDEMHEIFRRRSAEDEKTEALRARIDELTSAIEDGKNRIFDNLNEKGAIRSNIQRYETMLEQINIRKAELNSKMIAHKTDENQFDSSLSEGKKELSDIQAKIDSYESRISKLKDLIDSLSGEIRQNEEKLSLCKERHMRETSRLETLTNIAERYDGYTNSIRKVMECKEHNKGILGVVADIIKTDKKYELAIETALGGSIQNIVTDTESTAKKMIEFLKTNKFGRATFLPLDAVKPRTGNREKLDSERGFIGYASSLVSVDNEYTKLSESLLGRCVVTDTIDNAIAINRKYGYTLKIVTLEGDLLNPGGSMSGGAFKNSSNLLGRRREIEELSETIAKTAKAINDITGKLNQAKDERTANIAETEKLQASLQEELIRKNTAQLQYDQIAAKHEEVMKQYSDYHREYADIDDQIKDINDNLNTLRKELSDIEEYNERTNAEIAQMNDELEHKRIEFADASKISEGVHIEYSEISQKVSFAEENVKRVLREIEHLKESIESLNDNKEDAAKEIETKNSEIDNINEMIRIAGETITGYNDNLLERRNTKAELENSIKTFFDQREACQAKLVELEKEQFRLSQSRDKYENENDSHIDYMWDEYELTLSQAAELKDENLTDAAEMKKAVSLLKNDIKKLGDVNVNAIEEYKEVSERYEFLRTQHDDLVESKEKLIQVINELEKGMRELFTAKFEEIKVEFDKVFRQLFGGGKGTIVLDEEAEDILEADISIISQPPGKKLQNMMQLSGGEKALTAICLLFAIQNLKPSPFCLLDEIEAALDDNNVDRFAKYLHNLTKNTQFIVITHRRGTMACADRLYGITMQEKGVSALVSVDLIEKDLDDKPKN